jgi:NAD(P)-dependent dehydrogenase (short-subunit alcohol dehydrogenase family)
MCVVTDVSQAEDCNRLVRRTVERFGRLDCALNNAALGGTQALTVDYPEKIWDEVIAVNLKGVWNCMRFEITQMLKNNGGAILNVSSAATEPMQSLMSAYVASKCAVNGLTKTAGFEYAKYNIRINALVLGIINTHVADGCTSAAGIGRRAERCGARQRVLVACRRGHCS